MFLSKLDKHIEHNALYASTLASFPLLGCLPIKLQARSCVCREDKQLGSLVVSCSESDQPERHVRAPGSLIYCLFDRQPRHLEVQWESVPYKPLLLYRAMHYAGSFLSSSFCLSPPSAPCSAVKIDQQTLAFSSFFMPLAFTRIPPGAAAAGMRPTFLRLSVCASPGLNA